MAQATDQGGRIVQDWEKSEMDPPRLWKVLFCVAVFVLFSAMLSLVWLSDHVMLR